MLQPEAVDSLVPLCKSSFAEWQFGWPLCFLKAHLLSAILAYVCYMQLLAWSQWFLSFSILAQYLRTCEPILKLEYECIYCAHGNLVTRFLISQLLDKDDSCIYFDGTTVVGSLSLSLLSIYYYLFIKLFIFSVCFFPSILFFLLLQTPCGDSSWWSCPSIQHDSVPVHQTVWRGTNVFPC